MEETIEKNEKKIFSVKDELEKINGQTIFEFEKTVDDFEIEKVKAYTVNDENKTVCFLFYDNDFFAINRINYKDGYEYDATNGVFGLSENLNYRIKKIPNVAKTRKILNLEDIETRIYDISEYIVLLKKEDITVKRVNGQADIQEMVHKPYDLDYKKLQEEVDFLIEEEEIRLREERNIKNRLRKIAETAKYWMVEPFKILKNKLMKTGQIKMLSDGKHSVFDNKED